MAIEFDPAKDALNIAKHGLSLARAAGFELLVYLEDNGNPYGETVAQTRVLEAAQKSRGCWH